MMVYSFSDRRGDYRRPNGSFESRTMGQRAMQTGPTPTVVVRAGANVRITGADSDQVLALGADAWGFKLDRRGDTVEARFGANADLSVPFGSSVTVYSGANAELVGVEGVVAVYAGGNATLRECGTLAHASAGGRIDLECDDVDGIDLKLTAGGHIRCFIRSLTDARLMVNDAGGYWEGIIGHGRVKLRLKAGGRAVIVTDEEILAQPPSYAIGNVERPPGDKPKRDTGYV